MEFGGNRHKKRGWRSYLEEGGGPELGNRHSILKGPLRGYRFSRELRGKLGKSGRGGNHVEADRTGEENE